MRVRGLWQGGQGVDQLKYLIALPAKRMAYEAVMAISAAAILLVWTLPEVLVSAFDKLLDRDNVVCAARAEGLDKRGEGARSRSIAPRAVALVVASGNPRNELDVAPDREGCGAPLSVDGVGNVAIRGAQDVDGCHLGLGCTR